jgi:hypothetical protein
MPDTELKPEQTQDITRDDIAAIAADVMKEDEISPREPVREALKKVEVPKDKVESQEAVEPEKVPDTKDQQPAGMDPAIKDMLDNMAYRLKQAESRVGSLQNQLNASKQAVKEIKPEDTPSKKQIEEASENDQDWEDLKEEFPNWAKAIDARVAKFSSDAVGKIDKLSGLETDFNTRLEAEVQKVKDTFDKKIELVTLSFFHPKWKDTVKSDAYLKWLPTQPEHIQAKHGSPLASDAIEVLNRFNEFNKPPSKSPSEIAADRARRLKESKDLQTTHKETPPKSEADMSEEERRRKIASEVMSE